MTSGNLQLKKLKIGKVDGKHEYLTPISQREKDAFDAFLVPSSVDVSRFGNNDVIFVEGFRGTGKTSLLRWYAEKETRLGAVTDFVLFKSDLTESQRAHISSEIGISWTDIDAKSMEFSQDFKAAWIWFIIHKIGESLKQYPDLVDSKTTSIANNAVRLLGLNDDGIFQKAIGFMPKLEGAHVKVRADVKFFEAELAGDFRPDGNHGKITLDTLSKKVSWLISKLKLNKKLIICFDELEAFYHSDEQHKRDQRMVRDLLFSVSSLNDTFRKSGTAIHILAAVRSEVISSMGSLGQEIGRLVHDKGFLINWYHAKRSAQHPLMQIIRKKIQASERLEGKAESQDPIKEYFVGHVNGSNIESFLLDKSFYKPRDIVWRLSLAQVLFPEETKFTEEVLHQTEIMYSEKLWEEIRYELSASYSDPEVDVIESVFSGGAEHFELSQIQQRFDKSTRFSEAGISLIKKHSVEVILKDLYRLGAIGNSFRVGSSGIDTRNRWSFRGEPNLLMDKRMVVHKALFKRLSIVVSRKRGARANK